jgi:hypothetical protein
MKKVLQYRAKCGWNRMSAENAIWFIRKVFPDWPGDRLRLATYYLLKYGPNAGAQVRFDFLEKCREQSYKGFTGTEEYFQRIESEEWI